MSYLVSGGSSLASVVPIDSVQNYGSAGGFDTSKRSVSPMKDVNGDGFNDVIIGDPFASQCYVMFGTVNGFVNMTSGFTIFGEAEGQLTGWSVSGAGDVNNDTLSDIIIGAPFANGVGAFYVIYGRRVNNFDVYLKNLTASEGFVVYGTQKSDYVGMSVSDAGDVNGDGCDDVIAGGLMTSSFFSGAAFVVYGGRNLSLATTIADLTDPRGFKMYGTSYSYAGCSVSGAGDVNKDGLSDVVVGSLPQRSSLISTAYLVHGSKSALSDILLTGISGSQGMRITGSGSLTSFIGDVNQDGYSDVFVGSAAASAPLNVGYIVYSDLAVMTKLTSKPSTSPSPLPMIAPSLIPSKLPTRVPVAPTVIPTKTPSVGPTVVPTSPTFEPTPGVSQPSSQPSSVPTFPTIAPSEAPSEIPTMPPTESPSEAPTLLPTEAPSEVPTVNPTLSPSESPTAVPSDAPTSLSPTITDKTRTPFSIPTMLPTVKVSVTALRTYYVDGSESEIYQESGYQNYIVNSTTNVTITNRMGFNRYTIVKNPESHLQIVYLNNSNDVIDLESFTVITDFTELQMVAGSVILKLPNHQTVRIVNLKPANLTASNFLFFQDPGVKDNNSKTAETLSIVVGVLVGVGGLVFGATLLLRMCGGSTWGQTAAAVVVEIDHFLMRVKYDKRNGELVFEERLSSESDSNEESNFESPSQSVHSMSDFSINSDGMVIPKIDDDDSLGELFPNNV